MTQTTPSPSAKPPPPSKNPEPEETTEAEGSIRVKRLSFSPSPSLIPSFEGPEGVGPADPTGPVPNSEPPRGQKSTRSGSSPASSLVDLAELRAGIEGAVISGTGQLHELLSRDAYDDWADVYLADDQDAKGIAKPMSKLINRRTGALTGGNPDVADGIAIGIALAFYVTKQLGRLLAAKRARRQGADISGAKSDHPTDTPPSADLAPVSGIPAGTDRFA
jgi:hypothetical protein